MKVSDVLLDIGRPVAYYPGLRRITKSTTATIFLCQFIYWTGKGTLEGGWIYKTADEIEEETGLTYNEQVTARRNLVEEELIEEKYLRIEHRMLYRVNLSKIDSAWGASPKPQDPESRNIKMGKWANHSSLNSNAENTSQNTTDINCIPDSSQEQASPSENKDQFSDNNDSLNEEKIDDLSPSNDSKVLNLKSQLNVPRPEPIREPCDMDGITESMNLGYGGVKKRKSWITPEMQTLANKFCELSGVKFPLIKDKKDYGANAISWWKPLERMLYEVDYNVDRACELLEQGVDHMRKIDYMVIAPQSVEKAFVGAKVGGKKKTIRAKDAYDNWVEVEV